MTCCCEVFSFAGGVFGLMFFVCELAAGAYADVGWFGC